MTPPKLSDREAVRPCGGWSPPARRGFMPKMMPSGCSMRPRSPFASVRVQVFVGVLGLAGSACTSSAIDLDSLALPSTTRSMILSVEFHSELTAEAFNVESSDFVLERSHAFADAEGVRLTALLYDAPLHSLELTEGRLEEPPSNRPRRLIPSADLTMMSEPSRDGSGMWRVVDRPEGALGAFWIEDPDDFEFCASVGGCLSSASFDAGCDVPCATPEVEDPVPPEAPRFSNCPPGWRASDGICDPWPEGGRSPCPVGQHPVPGRPACSTIGRECPTGEWPTELPDDRTTLFVSSVYAGSQQDGSLLHPFRSVTQAVAAAQAIDGALIAVGRGDYEIDSTLVIDRSLEIRGACALGTALSPMAPSSGLAFEAVTAGRLVLRDVALRGFDRGVVVRGPSAYAHLDGVLIEAVALRAVDVDGGEVDLDSVAIVGPFAEALVVRAPSARVRANEISIVGATEAIAVRDVAALELSDAWIARNRRALAVEAGVVSVMRSVFEDNAQALFSGSLRSSMNVVDSALISSEGAGREPPAGDSLVLFEAGTSTLARIWLRDVDTPRLIVVGADASLKASDLGILGRRPECPELRRPLQVFGVLEASRLRVEACGAIALEARARAKLDDLVISSDRGGALATESEAHLDGHRWSLSSYPTHDNFGVLVLRGVARLNDVTAQFGAEEWRAMRTLGGALHVDRLRIESPASGSNIGVAAEGSSSVRIENSRIIGGMIGVEARHDSQVEMIGFEVFGQGRRSISVERPILDPHGRSSRILARDGWVRDVDVGARLPTREMTPDVFERVRYSARVRAFEYGPVAD